MIQKFLLVGAAGSLGAMSRYGIDLIVTRLAGRNFPVGTMVVNIAGCFLIGLCMMAAQNRFYSHNTAHFLTTGFLGAFTTFSTFSYQTMQLANRGAYGAAALNILLSVGLGLAAVALGMRLGSAL